MPPCYFVSDLHLMANRSVAERYLDAIEEAAARAKALLAQGGRVLVHCFGGCGRSGMAALRLLVELGEDPDEALARIRAVRSCAVETEAQMAWAMRPDGPIG